MENPQSWNRHSYTINNPINYKDSTGHCFEPASALICLGVLVLGAVAIKVGYDNRQIALQHPVELAHEQQVAKQWQDNCMGQCHYSHSVSPTPNVSVGGTRLDTPYNDLLVESDWTILNGIVSVLGVGVDAAGGLLPKPPPARTPADLYAISDGANPATVRSGDDAFGWFTDILGGEDKALPFLPKKPKAPTLYGDVPGGGTAYYRPITSSGNPALEFKNVPGLPNKIKFHFPE